MTSPRPRLSARRAPSPRPIASSAPRRTADQDRQAANRNRSLSTTPQRPQNSDADRTAYNRNYADAAQNVPAPAPPGGGGGGGPWDPPMDGSAWPEVPLDQAPVGGVATPAVPQVDINADSWLIEQMAKYDRDKKYQEVKNTSDAQKYASGYNDTMRALGWDITGEGGWSLDPNKGMYGTSLANNLNDFSSRGMESSGGFLQTDAGIRKDFDERRSGLVTGKKQYDDDLAEAWKAYMAEYNANRQADVKSTVERLAAANNIDKSQIPTLNQWGVAI